MTKILKEISIKEIEQDYQPDRTIWNEDDPRIDRIKNIIFDKLTLTERRIILIYSETASMREVGKRFGISTSKTYQLINEIRKKIRNELNSNQPNPDTDNSSTDN